MNATARVTDTAEAGVGTSLWPRLIQVAETSAQEAKGATDEGAAIDRCLVAILCAHAAVEAAMNEIAESDKLGTWWQKQRNGHFVDKWAALVERLGGAEPGPDSSELTALGELNADRDTIVHFRGDQRADGTTATDGPAVDDEGGIPAVRAYFTPTRARHACDVARASIGRLQDARTTQG